MSSTSYDVSWRGWDGTTEYYQAFSSFSALFFALIGSWIFFRLSTRFLGVLLVYKGLTAFWNHALNEAYPSLRYLDASAQLWLLNQIFVWVVVVTAAAGPHEPYYWSSRVIAALAAHLFALWVLLSPSLVVIVVAITQIGIMAIVIIVHEACNRKRWMAMGSLTALVLLLLLLFLLRNETSIFIGQFGMCWVHVTQYYVILGWYVFWSQRYERTLIWGCNDSWDAIYCC